MNHDNGAVLAKTKTACFKNPHVVSQIAPVQFPLKFQSEILALRGGAGRAGAYQYLGNAQTVAVAHPLFDQRKKFIFYFPEIFSVFYFHYLHLSGISVLFS